jgi:hypothetical protein
VLNCREVFLFNEHFVTKPARSRVAFGWHTDEGKQLPWSHSGGGGGMRGSGVQGAGDGGSSSSDGDDDGDENGVDPGNGGDSPGSCRPDDGRVGGRGGSDSGSVEYVSVWLALDDIVPGSGGLVLGGLGLPSKGGRRDRKAEAVAVCPMEAGDAVAFSSRLWHRSPPNESACHRRVFYAQFSAVPVTGPRSAFPLCFAVKLPTPAPGTDTTLSSATITGPEACGW